MRKSCLLAGIAAVATSLSLTCYAGEVQNYAHPTLFGSQAQVMTEQDAAYFVAGQAKKCPCMVSMNGKENVFVKSWASSMLTLMEKGAVNGEFNSKMPILRSELAVLMAEGLGLQQGKVAYKYSDIASGYWASEWINKALSAGVMIGYPDKTFKPDQPVTKAEVFATIAKVIDVPVTDSSMFAVYNEEVIQQIPTWAVPATKEVVASELLANVPNTSKLVNDEYLSREQVAYLVGTFRYRNLMKVANGESADFYGYTPVAISMKLSERIDARHSNVGDIFTAKTTKDVNIQGVDFPEGSTVKGIVEQVNRPGFKNDAYMKVRFVEISNDDVIMDLQRDLSAVSVDKTVNPNIVSRVLGAPLSAAGRVVGVAGRSVGDTVNVAANGLENLGGNLSDMLSDTFSLHPLKGLKSFGSGFITVGKGVFDITKLAVSGTFGLLYELGDEVRYLILPSSTNDSALNPDEEITIIY